MLYLERALDGPALQPEDVDLLYRAECDAIIVEGKAIEQGRVLSLPFGENSFTVVSGDPDLHPHARPYLCEQGLHSRRLANFWGCRGNLNLGFGFRRDRNRDVLRRTANPRDHQPTELVFSDGPLALTR